MAPGIKATGCEAAKCGDGILEFGEECDNGNKPGCQNCRIMSGYSCFGNLGGTSICGK